MSDIKKGLPVRTEEDADDRVQVKVADKTTVSQQLSVDTSGNAHVAVHGNDPTSTNRRLRVSEQGHVAVSGEYHASNNTDPSSVGLIGMVRNAVPADSQSTLRLTGIANGAGDVRSADVAIRHSNGEPISESNPLHVAEAESPGTEVVDPNEGVDVAAAGTSNHDYTVTAAKTLIVDEVSFGASARGSWDIQVETGVATGVYTSRAKRFTSVASPMGGVKFYKRLKVAAGVRIRVARTNTDNQAQSMYTTIVGVEV